MNKRILLGRFFLLLAYSLMGRAFVYPQLPPEKPEDLAQCVENGIRNNESALFTKFLGSQVMISIRGDRPGLYSRNQAEAILENFLGSRRTLDFRFTTTEVRSESGFSTGRAVILWRGKKETMQVYLRFLRIESRWTITQLNFY